MLPKGVVAQETGHNSMADRAEAAQKLLNAVMRDVALAKFAGEREEQFFWGMDTVLNGSGPITDAEISAKQYFWLKDIYDRNVVER